MDESFWSRFQSHPVKNAADDSSIYGHLNCLPIRFLSAIGSFQLCETHTRNMSAGFWLGQFFIEELVVFSNASRMTWRPHNGGFLVGDHKKARRNHGKACGTMGNDGRGKAFNLKVIPPKSSRSALAQELKTGLLVDSKHGSPELHYQVHPPCHVRLSGRSADGGSGPWMVPGCLRMLCGIVTGYQRWGLVRIASIMIMASV